MLAGVNSDEQCEEHKSRTVMTHAERCEAVRHCRWVDEVVPDAPWVIDQAFLDKVCGAFHWCFVFLLFLCYCYFVVDVCHEGTDVDFLSWCLV